MLTFWINEEHMFWEGFERFEVTYTLALAVIHIEPFEPEDSVDHGATPPSSGGKTARELTSLTSFPFLLAVQSVFVAQHLTSKFMDSCQHIGVLIRLWTSTSPPNKRNEANTKDCKTPSPRSVKDDDGLGALSFGLVHRIGGALPVQSIPNNGTGQPPKKSQQQEELQACDPPMKSNK